MTSQLLLRGAGSNLILAGGPRARGDVLQDCRYTSRASNYKTSEVDVDASDHKVDDSPSDHGSDGEFGLLHCMQAESLALLQLK